MKGIMDIQHVEPSRGGVMGTQRNPPCSHSALLMCSCFVCNVWGEKVGRHMTTLLWCFHLFGNSDQEFSLFSICFFSV